MFRLQLIGALLIATVSLLYPNAASAFKSTFKLPCMLSYNGKPPISTHCVASIDVSQRAVVEIVSTANGRRFIIENHKADIDEWYLDHERAVRISDEPITCYENREIKLCFWRTGSLLTDPQREKRAHPVPRSGAAASLWIARRRAQKEGGNTRCNRNGRCRRCLLARHRSSSARSLIERDHVQ